MLYGTQILSTYLAVAFAFYMLVSCRIKDKGFEGADPDDRYRYAGAVGYSTDKEYTVPSSEKTIFLDQEN